MIKFLILLLNFLTFINAWQSELSVMIDPGNRECFHQHFERDLNVELDFQVVSGGDLDISVWVSTPSNRVIAHHQRKVTGNPTFKTDESGEYRICFDNSFSRFASKQVHFYLGLRDNDNFVDPNFNTESTSEFNNQKLSQDQLGELDDKVQTFKDAFSRIYNGLEKAQVHMTSFRIYEQADREIMEKNFERVNFYSMVNIILMLVVGAIQTFMIRSLFEDRSKIGRVLRAGVSSTSSLSDDKRKMNY